MHKRDTAGTQKRDERTFNVYTVVLKEVMLRWYFLSSFLLLYNLKIVPTISIKKKYILEIVTNYFKQNLFNECRVQ